MNEDFPAGVLPAVDADAISRSEDLDGGMYFYAVSGNGVCRECKSGRRHKQLEQTGTSYPPISTREQVWVEIE